MVDGGLHLRVPRTRLARSLGRAWSRRLRPSGRGPGAPQSGPWIRAPTPSSRSSDALQGELRQPRAGTGGADRARYCYAVWLRHLVALAEAGVPFQPEVVLELGPGDTVGVGIMALLTGAKEYAGARRPPLRPG